jgi:hopanoid biosynthesis associated RND transporter like protein HpnN
LERSVAAALRRARLLSVFALLTAVAAAIFAAATLEIDSDTDALFADDLPFQVHARELEAEFPALRRQLVILIEGDSPAVAHRAAGSLADRLGGDRERFANVFAPGGGAFFDRNGLLYLRVEELELLAERLVWAQPFLAELAQDPSLPTLLRLLERAVQSAEDAEFPPTELAETMEIIAQSLATSGMPMAWDRWAVGGLEGTGTLRLVYAEPRLDFGHTRPTRVALEAIRAEADHLELDPDHGIRLRVTGDLALAAEELDTLRQQGLLLASLSFAGISVLLMLGLGSLRYSVAAIATLGVGLAWTAAFAAATLGRLNVLSVSFAVLFIGLGIDFAIHYATRLIERGSAETSPARALATTARASAAPLALCAGTTALAFFAFLPTGYRGIAELGWIAGSGMFFSLGATLFVFPAFALSLGRDPTRPVSSLRVPGASLGVRHPRVVVGAALGLVLVSLPALRAIRFDPDPIKLRDQRSESVQAFRQLVEAGPASLWTVEFAAANLDAAALQAARLAALPEVGHAITLDTFVPGRQAEKLAILSDLSLLLGDIEPRTPGPVDPQAAQRALQSLSAAIDEWLRVGAEPLVAPALRSLLDATEAVLGEFEFSTDNYRDVERLQQRVLGELPDWLARLSSALGAQPLGRGDLPRALRDRYVSASGRARVQLFASGDLEDPGEMEQFVDALSARVPGATGSAVRIVEAGRTVTRALLHALVYAAAAVSMLLLAVWRRPLRVLMLLFLVSLASFFTAASSRWLLIPINFANVIVLPLLVGIGVDSAIHLLHGEGERDRAVTRGVLLSGLTTLASFGCLAFSSHPGLASLGQLLALGVAWLLAVNLLLLPALQRLFADARRRSAQTR